MSLHFNDSLLLIETQRPLVLQQIKKLLLHDDVRVSDFLFRLPVRYNLVHNVVDNLNDIVSGTEVVLNVHITRVKNNAMRFKRRGIPHIIESILQDGSIVYLIFFKINHSYASNFAVGSDIFIRGKIEYVGVGRYKVAHPKLIKTDELIGGSFSVEVYYKLSGTRIAQSSYHELIKNTFNQLSIDDWLNDGIKEKFGFLAIKDALKYLHSPLELDDVGLLSCKKRLAYDELYSHNIALKLAKLSLICGDEKISPSHKKTLKQKLLSCLNFSLTQDQIIVIDEIEKDQFAQSRMMRLLQGDVGSGKTIVAFVAMLNAVESGRVAVMLAPTTLLAKQHYKNISDFSMILGIDVGLLTSGTTRKGKKDIQIGLKRGEIKILIATHAVLYGDWDLENMGLLVIDEQHRFGVRHRMALSDKYKSTDILMLSATPIPRTMNMIMYGDMTISILKQKPKNRIDIDTRILSLNKIDEMISGIKRAISSGEKVYWICPSIESDDENENALMSVTSRYEELCKVLDTDVVGFIHGKMDQKKKDDVMAKFIYGDIKVLVATTVVEVGVDVSDATIIVIEHSECFGLSQLHQLRGRVGRGIKNPTVFYFMDQVYQMRVLRDCRFFVIVLMDLK